MRVYRARGGDVGARYAINRVQYAEKLLRYVIVMLLMLLMLLPIFAISVSARCRHVTAAAFTMMMIIFCHYRLIAAVDYF